MDMTIVMEACGKPLPIDAYAGVSAAPHGHLEGRGCAFVRAVVRPLHDNPTAMACITVHAEVDNSDLTVDEMREFIVNEVRAACAGHGLTVTNARIIVLPGTGWWSYVGDGPDSGKRAEGEVGPRHVALYSLGPQGDRERVGRPGRDTESRRSERYP
jgi:hypothetical protein